LSVNPHKIFQKGLWEKREQLQGCRDSKIECGCGKCIFDFLPISFEKRLFNFMQDLRRKQGWVNKKILVFFALYAFFYVCFS
jgi:hypothetical protein